MKLPKSLPQRLGFALLLLLLLSGLVFLFSRVGPLAPTRVSWVKVEPGSFSPALFGIGLVEARRSYAVGPTVAGRVLRLSVDVGETVKAGQLLAEMDPVDLEQRLTALDASSARAASLIASAQAQLTDSRARQQLASVNAQRYVDLGAQNFISAGAVEAKLQEQTSSDAGRAGAEANLTAARHELQRLQAERAGLSEQRARLRLLAPSAGLVIAREAEAGSTVLVGQSVLRLIDPDSLWIKLRLDQAGSSALVAGLPAQIVLRSNAAQTLAGRVARVESVSDSVTEERLALVAFDRLPPGLTIGELAEVSLQLPATAAALLLPNASFHRRGDQLGVWRVDAAGLSFVPVRMGLGSLDGRVQVLPMAGQPELKQGDKVVTFSETELRPDSRIKVVDTLLKGGT